MKYLYPRKGSVNLDLNQGMARVIRGKGTGISSSNLLVPVTEIS
jgi:hypothetical protein